MYIVQLGFYIRSMLCACKRDERIYFRCFHQVYIKENWCSGGNHNSSQIFSLLQWEEEEGLEQFEKCALSVNENWHGCWSCLLVVRKTLIGFFGSTPSFISFLSRFQFHLIFYIDTRPHLVWKEVEDGRNHRHGRHLNLKWRNEKLIQSDTELSSDTKMFQIKNRKLTNGLYTRKPDKSTCDMLLSSAR